MILVNPANLVILSNEGPNQSGALDRALGRNSNCPLFVLAHAQTIHQCFGMGSGAGHNLLSSSQPISD